MRFICPKHSVKSVVLLFHLTEHQFRRTLARVEVRRFQFLVMLTLVGIPLHGYWQYSPDTYEGHSCLTKNFSNTAFPMCRNRRHRFHRLFYCRGTGPLFVRDIKEPIALDFFIILLNAEDVIGPLQLSKFFMKRYAIAFSKFL